MKNCRQCQTAFEIEDWDRKFYERMQVPEPTLCPPCRQQRRSAWINQIYLYKRKCDATGVSMISNYAPESPYKVYDQAYWYGGDWDATSYGRDYDFNRPFFEQFNELSLAVPRPALMATYSFSENSDYVNHAGFNKNCYMIFDADYNRDCMYGLGFNKSESCMDGYRTKESELCYETVDCFKCYRLYFSQDCQNCSDSAFLKNCIGVRNSFMCSNLKNKEYYVFNKPYDKEAYEELMASLASYSKLQNYFKDWAEFKLRYPQKHLHGFQNVNVLGDYVVNSKDSSYCFDSIDLWDCKYFTRSFGATRDSMDCDECGDYSELFYESINAGFHFTNVRFVIECVHHSSNLTYCIETRFCNDLFGCVSLQRKNYCILNKQYSKEEYHALVPRIIEHMKSTGEWGEFPPVKYSPFGYNESLAQEYHPLTKEEALSRGWKWRDADKQSFGEATVSLPDTSTETDKSICQEVLKCEACGKNYKIVEQELAFYKERDLALPRKCFYCRHEDRLKLRNPRVFYDRNCGKCGVDIKTTYSPDRPEKVYCEQCYLNEVH
jgi:hypothetical protein